MIEYRENYLVIHSIREEHPLTHEVFKTYPDIIQLTVERITYKDHFRTETIPVYSEILK